MYYNLANEFGNKKSGSFLVLNFYPLLIASKIDMSKYIFPDEVIKKVLHLLVNNKITNSEATDILKKLIAKEEIFELLIEYYNRIQVSTIKLDELINKIIIENKDLISEYPSRPERVFKFLMGQIMKETKGKVNAKTAGEKIKIILSSYE